ncbi:glycosyltransferase [Glaciecola sp. SC05]|uniref:glycosyltransferase n=1 Tax=Glaciecola sp. SC05 TaxID=1987355 RepID=UPI003527E6A5
MATLKFTQSSYNPLVTVYITTFNRLALLKRAIQSVKNQTYQNIELIIADDGSSDGTQEYLKGEAAISNLIAFCNEGDAKGACFGRNRAIEKANGIFITGLDDDDYFEPWRIESFVSSWQRLTAEGINYAGLFDSVVEHRKYAKVRCYETAKVSIRALRRANVVGNQVFTTAANLREINGFDELMPALQDWDTWIRLTQAKGDLLNINTFSYVQIHDHGGNRISEKPASKIRFAFERLQSKLAPMSFSEKAALMQTMYSYPQINNLFSEILLICLGGYFRKCAQIINRTYFKKNKQHN